MLFTFSFLLTVMQCTTITNYFAIKCWKKILYKILTQPPALHHHPAPPLFPLDPRHPWVESFYMFIGIAFQLIIVRNFSYIYFFVSRSHRWRERWWADGLEVWRMLETRPPRKFGGFGVMGPLWHLPPVVPHHLCRLEGGAGWRYWLLLFLVNGKLICLCFFFCFVDQQFFFWIKYFMKFLFIFSDHVSFHCIEGKNYHFMQ